MRLGLHVGMALWLTAVACSPSAAPPPAPPGTTMADVADVPRRPTPATPGPVHAPVGTEVPPRAQLSAEVGWSGGVVRAGERVKLRSRASWFEPAETGHARGIAFGPGQVGTVLGGFRHQRSGVELEEVVVQWDAQAWREWSPPYQRAAAGRTYTVEELDALAGDYGPPVELPAFELAVHPAFLTPAP